MDMQDIIITKRDGGKLSREQIEYFVKGCAAGAIPDYQTAALLMAIYLNKMDREETVALTDAMLRSGDRLDLSGIRGVKVDKHSTGGVGDTTTLIAGPLAAACGVPVAKMSGRGLGFSGGTIDKLASIPGFRTALTEEAFRDQVNRIGIAVTGQTGVIAPADKKIYALRDVTGTVENMSLIASSIMSKKLAAGSDAILLDVKCGGGAFMKDRQAARELGELMCGVGRAAGKRTVAAVTAMDQPLGLAVGNALEVKEAIRTLKGEGPKDLTDLCVFLSGWMVCLGGAAPNYEEGERMTKAALASGQGLAKLGELIEAQGGDPRVIDDPALFPISAARRKIRAQADGFVSEVRAEAVGVAARLAGAGRETKDDEIDPGAGVELARKVGDPVRKGEVLALLWAEDEEKAEAARPVLQDAFVLTEDQPAEPPLLLEVIGE